MRSLPWYSTVVDRGSGQLAKGRAGVGEGDYRRLGQEREPHISYGGVRGLLSRPVRASRMVIMVRTGGGWKELSG